MYIFCTLWSTDSVNQMTQKTRFTLVSDSLKLDSVKRIKFTITSPLFGLLKWRPGGHAPCRDITLQSPIDNRTKFLKKEKKKNVVVTLCYDIIMMS